MAAPVLQVRVAATLNELKANLAEGVNQIEITRSALQRMANGYDGSRIISQAGATAAAIQQIGGVTKLTEAEQARANAVIEQALDKYRALGKEAPPGLQDLADSTKRVGVAATETDGRISGLHRSMTVFDGILSAAGIHIGPDIRGIEDLGDAAGKSASELGKIATAGLIIGAGLVGWKIGRAIADFFDLDDKIAHATASLLGFGDAAGEVAGAKQDVITRAIERGAAATISYTEALKFNASWFKEHQKAATAAAEALQRWNVAMVDINSAGDGWQGTLATIDGTVVEAIKYYLQAGVAQDKLATAYDLTATQVKAVASAMSAEADAAKKAADEDKKASDAIAKHWSDVGAVLDKVLGVDAVQKATAWADAIDALGGSVAQLSNTDLAELNQAMLAGIDSLARMGQLTSDQSSRFAALAVAADAAKVSIYDATAADIALRQALYDEAVAQDAAIAAQQRANDETQRSIDLKKSLDVLARGNVSFGGTPIDAAYIQAHQFDPAFQLMQLQAEIRSRQSVGGIPGRAAGGPVTADTPYIVGEHGPELLVPRSAGTIIPTGSVGGNTYHFYITQPLGTPQAIAKAVDEALMNRQRGIGVRFPSRA